MPVLHACKAHRLFQVGPVQAVHTTMLYIMACKFALIPDPRNGLCRGG